MEVVGELLLEELQHIHAANLIGKHHQLLEIDELHLFLHLQPHHFAGLGHELALLDCHQGVQLQQIINKRLEIDPGILALLFLEVVVEEQSHHGVVALCLLITGITRDGLLPQTVIVLFLDVLHGLEVLTASISHVALCNLDTLLDKFLFQVDTLFE